MLKSAIKLNYNILDYDKLAMAIALIPVAVSSFLI
jgi:hypothetical protein